MRVGFDVSQTGRYKTGCGYFAKSLARQLIARASEHTFILYPTFGNGYWDEDWPKTTLSVRDRANVVRGLGHHRLDELESFWLKPPPDQEDQLGLPDIVHSNNFFCPNTFRKARLVYTLHDLAFADHPEWTSEANWRVCFEGVFNASARADHIIAVSDFTRRQFLSMFPHFPEERISVTYEASRFAGPSRAPAPGAVRHLRSGEFWLASGDEGLRKNGARLLDAYRRLMADIEASYPLVLFGGSRQPRNDMPSVERLGYVDDPTLQWLYENCTAFLYPSLYEGFGLPVVEAMSLGAPVLTSNVTSLPEVVGDSAIMVDSLDTESIYMGMRRLLLDAPERRRLRTASLERARHFSWTEAASQVLDVYRSLVTEYPPIIERNAFGVGVFRT